MHTYTDLNFWQRRSCHQCLETDYIDINNYFFQINLCDYQKEHQNDIFVKVNLLIMSSRKT